MIDETVRRTMLFDFYGELLTNKQRDYYNLHYNEDLTLQEIADHNGVSRQAVWDIIHRAEMTLTSMEQKTGIVERLVDRRKTLEQLFAEARKLPDCPEKTRIIEMLAAFEE